MTITNEDMKILQAHFPASEHEFDYAGYVYIKEMSICQRIEAVDPAWSMTEPVINWRLIDGKQPQVTVQLGITIKGVTRYGVGKKAVEYLNNKTNKQTGEVFEHRDHIEANQAEKSAATDALKRTARLFGIGRYLLGCPKGVKNEQQLETWLQGNWGRSANKKRSNGNSKPQAQHKAQTPKPAPKNAQNGVQGESDPPFAQSVEWPKFWVHMKTLGLDSDDVHKALGVDSAKDFEGTKSQAMFLLDTYAKKKNKLVKDS